MPSDKPDHPASRLLSQYLRPHPALRPWVSHYWELSGQYHPADARATQQIVTWGNTLLLFQLGDPIDVLAEDGTRQARPAAFTYGHFRAPFRARYAGRFRLAGVSFLPGHIHHFLRDSQQQINDRFVDLRDVLGDTGRRLSERISGSLTFRGMARVFDEELLSLRPPGPPADLGLRHAILLAARYPNAVNVGQLAYEACLSPRQLERRFREALGLSPKYFCQVARLGLFVRAAGRLPQASLTRLSHECGYFDQAHLINEFRRFTGVTPSSYLSNDYSVVAAVSRMDTELGAPTPG